MNRRWQLNERGTTKILESKKVVKIILTKEKNKYLREIDKKDLSSLVPIFCLSETTEGASKQCWAVRMNSNDAQIFATCSEIANLQKTENDGFYFAVLFHFIEIFLF